MEDLLIEIEKFLGKKIPVAEITKKDYQTVLDLTNEKSLDDLLGQIEFELGNDVNQNKKKRLQKRYLKNTLKNLRKTINL